MSVTTFGFRPTVPSVLSQVPSARRFVSAIICPFPSPLDQSLLPKPRRCPGGNGFPPGGNQVSALKLSSLLDHPQRSNTGSPQVILKDKHLSPPPKNRFAQPCRFFFDEHHKHPRVTFSLQKRLAGHFPNISRSARGPLSYFRATLYFQLRRGPPARNCMHQRVARPHHQNLPQAPLPRNLRSHLNQTRWSRTTYRQHSAQRSGFSGRAAGVRGAV